RGSSRSRAARADRLRRDEARRDARARGGARASDQRRARARILLERTRSRAALAPRGRRKDRGLVPAREARVSVPQAKPALDALPALAGGRVPFVLVTGGKGGVGKT